MWKKLKGRLSADNALAAARANGTLPDTFVSIELTFLCLPDAFREGLPATATQEEALNFIEKAAADLAARGSFEPFVYTGPDGSKALPIFTQARHAESFTRSYVNEVRRIIPFQLLTASGASLVPAFSRCDVVIVNPRSDDELLLSKDEVRSIIERGA